jgi:starch-binding outer membrane protein, SusD/RagB family
MFNRKLIPVIIFVGLLFASCSDFLETHPRDAISDQDALTDIQGVEAALAGVYNRVSAAPYYGAQMILAGALLADQFKIPDANSGRMVGYQTNQAGSGFGLWSRLYNDINRLNTIMFYIDDIDDVPQFRVNNIKGEALFLRGLMYFDLLRTYARPYLHQQPFVDGQALGVILRTQHFIGLDPVTSYPERSSIEAGYLQVEKDLLDAIELLGSSSPVQFPYRANQAAAQALLARLYLYMGRWVDARDMAQATLNNRLTPSLSNAANYRRVFSEVPGIESIWEIGYTESDRPQIRHDSPAGFSYDPATDVGYGDIVFRKDLLDQFEEGDVRADMTVAHVKQGQPVVFQTKFLSYRGFPYWDDIPVLRTAEIYLILAEAHAELGEYDEARETINTLRTNRRLPALSSGQLPDSGLLDLVLHERRIELLYEHGHRWFDLRRRGMDIPKGDPTYDPGSPLDFADYRVVERIPDAETAHNTNCVQNPGY